MILIGKSTDLNQVTIPFGAGIVVKNVYEFNLADLKGAALAANDIIDIGVLPAFATVADAVLVTDDLDTNASPTLTLDVGVMSGAPGTTDGARACGNEIFAASNVSQAGGVARPTKKEAFRIAPAAFDRSIGVKIAAAAATLAAAGKITLILFINQ